MHHVFLDALDFASPQKTNGHHFSDDGVVFGEGQGRAGLPVSTPDQPTTGRPTNAVGVEPIVGFVDVEGGTKCVVGELSAVLSFIHRSFAHRWPIAHHGFDGQSPFLHRFEGLPDRFGTSGTHLKRHTIGKSHRDLVFDTRCATHSSISSV